MPSADDHQVLMDLLSKIEPLHEDLVPYLQDWTDGGAKMIHHPLVISLPHSDLSNAWVNQSYAHKLAGLEQAQAAGDWTQYVFLHERPYRLDALMEVVYEFEANDPKVWSLIAHCWTDCENIHQNLDEWFQLWDASIPGIENAMTEEERAALAALPPMISVYRGMGHRDAVEGMSWTTDRTKAEWFAKRFASLDDHTPLLAIGEIKRENVVAYLLGRNEREIVAYPDDVTVTDVLSLKP